MHVHGSWSEGTGSWQAQFQQAAANGYDLLYLTDHDIRMLARGYLSSLSGVALDRVEHRHVRAEGVHRLRRRVAAAGRERRCDRRGRGDADPAGGEGEVRAAHVDLGLHDPADGHPGGAHRRGHLRDHRAAVVPPGGRWPPGRAVHDRLPGSACRPAGRCKGSPGRSARPRRHRARCSRCRRRPTPLRSGRTCSPSTTSPPDCRSPPAARAAARWPTSRSGRPRSAGPARARPR